MNTNPIFYIPGRRSYTAALTRFLAVSYTHLDVYKRQFGGWGAIPRIDGRCQHQQIAIHHRVKDFLHIVLSRAAENRPVLLTGPAGQTGLQVFLVKIKARYLGAAAFQLFCEGGQQCCRVTLCSRASHQNAYLHRVSLQQNQPHPLSSHP